MSAPIALAALVALVFVFPARAVVSGLGAAGRPHLLGAASLLLMWLVLQLHPRFRPTKLPGLLILVLVYVGWVVLAWAAGYDRGLTLMESRSSDRSLIATLAYLGVVLVAGTGLRTRREVDLVLKTVVAGATFSALVGWLQFWLNYDVSRWLFLPGLIPNGALVRISERGSGELARVAGTAGHFIEFGVVCAIIVPLAVHYARTRPKGKRKLAWVAVVLIGGAVPFSISRSGVVALAITAVVMLFGWPRRARFNAIGSMLMVVPLYMAIKPGLLGTIRSLFTNAASDPSITGRTEDYATAWAYVSERPLIGRGPGTFTPDQYILVDNQWLLSLIETGWVGGGLLALIFIATFRTLMTVRRRAMWFGDRRQADLALSLLAVIVTLAVTAAFFDQFYFTTATTVLWLTVGVSIALSEHQRRRFAELGVRPLSAGGRLSALVDLALGRPRQLSSHAWI